LIWGEYPSSIFPDGYPVCSILGQMSCQPTILLVEDDPNDALFVRVALRSIRPDVRLVVVEDGPEAIKFLQIRNQSAEPAESSLPDAVLLDLKLPMMTGFQVLRWIRNRARLKDLPVVVLSGSFDERDSQAAYGFGANSFIIKPCSVDNLRKTLQHICERWLESISTVGAGKPAKPTVAECFTPV